MGTGLEMKSELRSLIGAALSLALLSACGTDPAAGDGKTSANSLKAYFGSLLGKGRAANPAETNPAQTRALLAQLGQPITYAKVDKLGYFSFMSPYGNNGPVQTWASSAYETFSLKGGILVATRGLGPDLMTAVVPSLGQVRSGSGSFHRVYFTLDGADQPQRADFECSFKSSGSETVTVLDRGYPSQRVTESCSNAETQFENMYWFDSSGNLRQSLQHVSEQAASVQLQRAID